MRIRTFAIGLFIFILSLLFFASTPISAAPTFSPSNIFIVNELGDGSDANIGDGVCDVNLAASGDQCTLRAAIEEANASPGHDDIRFSLPGSPPHTIAPLSPLPSIYDSVTIDGVTGNGSCATSAAPADLNIILDGFQAGASTVGLNLPVDGNVIKGLVIGNFSNDAIAIPSNNNEVICNFLGVAANGVTNFGNYRGVFVSGLNNTIGGNLAGDRNVISGNNSHGIYVVDNDNTIQGNIIGLMAAGDAELANGDNGITVASGAMNTLIGGSGAAEGNIISGNQGNGVEISNINFVSLDNSTIIRGNIIGLATDGVTARANKEAGIYLSYSDSNIIGGAGSDEGNIISGNENEGVKISNSSFTTIQGNSIGADASGATMIGNGKEGVLILSGANTNIVGGVGSGEGNTIAGNGGDGVRVWGASTDNRIRGNQMSGNGRLGIDLYGAWGVDPNDPLDSDTGPNDLQNYPEITDAVYDVGSGNLTISGELHSAASKSYDLDFYHSVNCDASGYGEGNKYLQSLTVNTDANGDASFSTTFAVGFSGGQITSTATDQSALNTSEFSACSPVVRDVLVVNDNGTADDSNPGDGVCDVGLGICTFRAAIQEANALGFPLISIHFNIPSGGGAVPINDFLPDITTPVNIDGTTQSGSACASGSAPATLNIWLDGNNGYSGLKLAAGSDGSAIRGLAITRMADDGILVNSDNNTIACNNIGAGPAGTVAGYGNQGHGVNVESSGNIIGGSIGTERNVIVGNGASGIQIRNGGTGNTVIGNLVGLAADGITPIGNTDFGILLNNGDGNTLGGGSADLRNVASGNGAFGIYLRANSDGNMVTGNYVGLDYSGSQAVGNGTSGVNIRSSVDNLVSENHIAYNSTKGVRIGDASQRNHISRNSIHENGELGIDLAGNGVTANDEGDADAGPNDLQNFFDLTGAFDDSGTLIEGVMRSAPNATYTIEFFTSTAADASGYGEGEIYQLSRQVTTDANGEAIFSENVGGSLPLGQFMTATATDASGSTSEFSNAVELVACTSPAAAAPAPGISGSDFTMTWPAATRALQYDIHHAVDDPYFGPNPATATTAALNWTDTVNAGEIGDPANNYYYLVRTTNGCGDGPISQRVGEFDFALTPGTP